MTQRRLIVNADDFGLSPGVNRGVLQAHERGVVTSASLLVRRPHAEAAVREARSLPDLSLGLHLDLGEWVHRDGRWSALYEVVPTMDPEAVGEELEKQLRAFRSMTGVEPTHIDSHQHVHSSEPARSIVLATAADMGLPVRGFGAVRYCGDFYGQTGKGEPFPDGISLDRLLRIVTRLGLGVTELGCHPGVDSDAGAPYATERAIELAVLCDPDVPQALSDAGIELVSFHQLEEEMNVSIA